MGSAGGSVLILCSFLFYVLLAVLVLRFCFGSRSSRCRPVSFEKIQRNSHFHAPSLCDTPTRSSPTRRTDQSNSFRQTQSQATNKTNEVRGYPPPPKPPPARFDFEFLLADRLTWVLEPQPLPTEYDLVHNNQIGWTIPTDGACSRPLLPTQPETQCLTLSLFLLVAKVCDPWPLNKRWFAHNKAIFVPSSPFFCQMLVTARSFFLGTMDPIDWGEAKWKPQRASHVLENPYPSP